MLEVWEWQFLKLNLLDKNSLEKAIEFKLKNTNLLITFHPVTLENNTSKNQMNELLIPFSLKETGLIFTMPNADTDSKVLFEMIQNFVQKNTNAKVYASLDNSDIYLVLNMLMQ